MSLIRLGELTINTDSQIVMLQGEEIRLEPRQYELLLLFCEKSEEIVTRDHILDNIWQGTIVTDNAVSKLVASLRKQLKDNPANPQYIQTVPKRGYRLVAVKSLNRNTESELRPGTDSPARPFWPKTSIATVFALFFVALLAFWGVSYFNTDESEKLTSGDSQEVRVKALTKMSGLERSPIISEDQQFILYLRENIQTGHRSLWYKNLSNEQTQKIPGLTPFASRLVALTQENTAWQLFYLAQENDSCRLSKLEINAELSVVSDALLLDCTGLEIFDVSFSKKRNSLYYSAKAEHGLQARVYRLDLNSKDSNTSTLITQPEIQGKGNRGIDLSPDEEKLLIVQLDKEYNSQLYVLNLPSNDLKARFFVPHNIAQASWDKDSQHILYFAPFPSRQILRNDESGSNQQVVLTMSEYLEAGFSRIPNSPDILSTTPDPHWPTTVLALRSFQPELASGNCISAT
ncbi:winged helix-turn-helix domain-containing protein [Planctobacterium marinum]|uniref:winged helix-turn-helix domain-containing protein n=1 Tax=Planctobacterium marinum TaxID=1631968 RepID=UPI001E2D2D98|nr:winged helix-turn-helix domain-containing protein [Planctobacterium marinum]MCC2606762.1 winged helix-turn-helix domain-containing protein [Planctobacterium marinum]